MEVILLISRKSESVHRTAATRRQPFTKMHRGARLGAYVYEHADGLSGGEPSKSRGALQEFKTVLGSLSGNPEARTLQKSRRLSTNGFAALPNR